MRVIYQIIVTCLIILGGFLIMVHDDAIGKEESFINRGALFIVCSIAFYIIFTVRREQAIRNSLMGEMTNDSYLVSEGYVRYSIDSMWSIPDYYPAVLINKENKNYIRFNEYDKKIFYEVVLGNNKLIGSRITKDPAFYIELYNHDGGKNVYFAPTKLGEASQKKYAEEIISKLNGNDLKETHGNTV